MSLFKWIPLKVSDLNVTQFSGIIDVCNMVSSWMLLNSENFSEKWYLVLFLNQGYIII